MRENVYSIWFVYLLAPSVDKRKTRLCDFRDVADGWTGWAIAHPGFGRSVNPISYEAGWAISYMGGWHNLG